MEVFIASGEYGVLGKSDAQPDWEILLDGYSGLAQIPDLGSRAGSAS